MIGFERNEILSKNHAEAVLAEKLSKATFEFLIGHYGKRDGGSTYAIVLDDPVLMNIGSKKDIMNVRISDDAIAVHGFLDMEFINETNHQYDRNLSIPFCGIRYIHNKHVRSGWDGLVSGSIQGKETLITTNNAFQALVSQQTEALAEMCSKAYCIYPMHFKLTSIEHAMKESLKYENIIDEFRLPQCKICALS